MVDRRVRRRIFLKYAAAATGAFLAPTLLASRPTRVTSAPETLDTVLEPVRAAHGVPALASAFIQGADLVGLGAVGLRRIGATDMVRATDRFHIGSCTKSMTATLLALLVEQGRLTWDTKIPEVFPDLRSKIHAGFQSVTLVQLLSHRGGLPMGVGRDSPILPQVVAALSGGPLPQQRRTLLELVLSQSPAFRPGSRMLYSNLGYTIAGTVAEQVTGQAWEDLMRERLFAPLSMTAVGFGAPGIGNPWGHSQDGCQPIEPGPGADNPPAIGPAGTVHSSLPDWGRYASLHLRGARGEGGLLLKPESFQQLHRDHFQQGYSLGWAVLQPPWAGGTTLAHDGSNTFWYAYIWIFPARNAALLAATNCGSQSGARAAVAAIEAMVRNYLG